MYYIAMMWLIVLATVLFAEYFHTNSSIGKTQMYADLLSDGAAFVGNNGWGLEEKKATKTYNKLISLNKNNFKDCKPQKLKFSNTDSKGKTAKYDSSLKGEKNKNNTTNVTVQLTTKTLSTQSSLERTKTASTRITYSGGLKVVLEAYKHSYTYNHASQTAYTWGGGHGIAANSLAWEQSADCSGFVTGVFRKCGYYVTSDACTWDLEGTGKLVSSLDKARPGDIILFWYGEGTSQHVAIYAGKKNGVPYIIHARGNENDSMARGPSKGVDITPLSYVGYTKMMIRRIVDTQSDAYEIQLKQLMAYGLTRNEAICIEGLRSAGYSNTAIAAAMGNMQYESGGFNPDMVEAHTGDTSYLKAYHDKIVNGKISKYDFISHGKDESGHIGNLGYGICQWTTIWYSGGNQVSLSQAMQDRPAKLWDYAKRRGSNVADIYTQVSYAIHEMHTSHAAVSSHSSFNKMTNIAQATEYFQIKFEGCTNDSTPARISNARRYYSILTKIPK